MYCTLLATIVVTGTPFGGATTTLVEQRVADYLRGKSEAVLAGGRTVEAEAPSPRRNPDLNALLGGYRFKTVDLTVNRGQDGTLIVSLIENPAGSIPELKIDFVEVTKGVPTPQELLRLFNQENRRFVEYLTETVRPGAYWSVTVATPQHTATLLCWGDKTGWRNAQPISLIVSAGKPMFAADFKEALARFHVWDDTTRVKPLLWQKGE
jgi:hypothetical protein